MSRHLGLSPKISVGSWIWVGIALGVITLAFVLGMLIIQKIARRALGCAFILVLLIIAAVIVVVGLKVGIF
jgi:uncharacterized membrane protein